MSKSDNAPPRLPPSTPAMDWSPDRVSVIEEDQGQSGQSMVTRLGFQRLLAEVS